MLNVSAARMTTEEREVLDVVIVGAGISGLAAAHKLVSSEVRRLVVLEAKDRVGGRTDTVQLKAADGRDGVWDIGGQWVGRDQSDVINLLDEFGIGTYQQHMDGQKVLLLNGRNKSTYTNSIPTIQWYSLIDLQKTITQIDRAAFRVPVDDPLRCREAEDWDRMTLEDFFQSHIWTKSAAEIHRIVPRITMGAEPSQLSLLYCLHFCNSAGGLLKFAETAKGSAQEWKIRGSTASMIRCLADSVGRDQIFCEQPVVDITQVDDIAIVQTLSGRKFKTKQVILAIPPQQILRITMNPALPSDHCYLLQHMPVGHLIKFVSTYSTAFWRSQGYSGEVVSSSVLSDRVEHVAAVVGISLAECVTYSPVCCVWDATTEDGLPALVGLQGGKPATQWSGQPLDFHKRVILTELKYLLGEEAENPIDFTLRDWSTVPWNGGCPVSFITPGAMTSFGGYKTLRRPWQHIHFAGTELATRWCGYMSGAVQSGYRAAAEVLHCLNPDQWPLPLDTTPDGEKTENHKPWNLRFLVHLLLGAGALVLGWYTRQRWWLTA